MGRTFLFLSAAMFFGGDKPTSPQPNNATDRQHLAGIHPVPLDQKSVEESRREGTNRAEIDYKNGIPEIERFGLVLIPDYFDAETGLPLKSRGCVSTPLQQIESIAYNDRVLELVKYRGLPPQCVELRARFRRAKELIESPPVLDWITVPLRPHDSNGKPIKLGDLTVTRKTYTASFPHSRTFGDKKAPPTEYSKITVNRDTDELVSISVSFRDPTAIALVENEGFLIVRGTDWTQRTVVFDTKHDRILVDAMPGLRAALKKLDDPSKPDKPEPHF